MAAANPFYTQLVGASVPLVPPRPLGVMYDNTVGKKTNPIYLQPMDPRAYIDFFNTYLTAPNPVAGGLPLTVRQRVDRALGWVAGGPPGQQTNLPRPQSDTALTMESEGDVVRAAQLYLIAPVETLVRRIYGLDNAVAPVTGVTRFWSTAEETRGDYRTDLAWYATTVDNNNVATTRCVLILEFKKLGTLYFEDFMFGLGCPILPIDWDAEELNKSMAKYPTKSDVVLPRAAIQGLEYQTSISKDAPQRVILFDYETMAMLQFPGKKPADYKGVLGITWQSETSSAWRGLVNTNVFGFLQQQDNTTKKRNTIGTQQWKDTPNKNAIDLVNNNRQNVPTPAGGPPPDGTFAEMLLTCLLAGIDNV